ncbi:MAG: carbon-nitrogen hydrolase family protein [Desulfitobacteriaceae bacterium]
MKLRLGLVQDSPVLGDIEATFKIIEDYAVRAGKNGLSLDMIVYPELFITGYLPEFWEKNPTPRDELLWQERLVTLAQRERVGILCGHPSFRAETSAETRTGLTQGELVNNGAGKLYNAASLITGDGVIGTYAKVHLFGKESQIFTPGNIFPVWDTPWGKISVQVCFDLEFPEGARIAALQGAEILLLPTNNMIPYGRFHEIYAMARAMENGIFVVYANRTGLESDIDFCGGSCVAHPNGQWVLEPQHAPGLYACELDTEERKVLDPALDYLKLRKPVLYRAISTT